MWLFVERGFREVERARFFFGRREEDRVLEAERRDLERDRALWLRDDWSTGPEEEVVYSVRAVRSIWEVSDGSSMGWFLRALCWE